jgi:hypothetical protein
MSDWVKFHREIMKGAKRGLPRATRFIYMELSSEARPRAGVIDLATGMDDVDAVVDLLGGNVPEIKAALPKLMAGENPMIRFEGPKDARRLVVVTWEKWNAVPGDSTERVRRHRNAKVTPPVTDMKRVTSGDNERCETPRQPDGNAPRSDQRREEKRERSSPPPLRGSGRAHAELERPAADGGGAGGFDALRALVRAELVHPAFAPIREKGTEDATIEAVLSTTLGRKPAEIVDAVRAIAAKAGIEGFSESRLSGALAAAHRFIPKPERGHGPLQPLTPSTREGTTEDFNDTEEPSS